MRPRSNDQGPGPRGTPTVDGDRLYVLTENGDLACLKTDGTVVWHRNILRDFGGPQLRWLISESPLVDGPHLIVSPGGPGAGMVKLDKMTGKTVWTAKDLSDPAGYSSVIAADVQGVRTYMTFTAAAGVGVRASDGKLMFRYPKAANRTANIATPIFSNNKVFFTSAYGTGGGLLDLTAQNGEVTRERGVLHAQHEEPPRRRRPRRRLSVRVQRCDPDLPRVRDGQRDVAGSQRRQRVGDVRRRPASTFRARTTSSDWRKRRRPATARRDVSSIPDKGLPSWAHPVISDGRLYVRNQDTLLVYDIKSRATP